VSRHRCHHRAQPSREGPEEHGIVLERRHKDAIAGRQEQLESKVNGESTGWHKHALSSGAGLKYRLDVTFDLIDH
jgi:hypothetical protein